MGFSLDQKVYFYRVAPFGAAFSAHWWSRLGGFFLRLFHYLLWLSHVGFLYVDDFLLWQDHEMMPCSAAMICILCQLTCIPVSWKKCELAPTIKWIGWVFHIHAGFVNTAVAIYENLAPSSLPRLVPASFDQLFHRLWGLAADFSMFIGHIDLHVSASGNSYSHW